MRWTRLPLILPALGCLAMPAGAQIAKPDGAPEPGTGRTAKSAVYAKRFMVAAANPHAVRAGVEMLKAGGSAADAAIAVQLVLGLVEPQSSGIGGGAFALYWTASDKQLRTYDGRETAPAEVTVDLFRDSAGALLKYRTAIQTGRSVGTPGLVALLWRLHQRHGRLPWARLFQPAIRLATEGFQVSPRLHHLLKRRPVLRARPATRAYFFRDDGAPWPVGHRLRNPAYAETLSRIARHGPKAFYQGPVAQDIIRAVRSAMPHPGRLALRDLAAYKVVERPPVCGAYRRWRVCGMGPPSSGGIAVIQILKQLEGFGLSRLAPTSAPAAHLIVESGRLAFADRNRYVGDPDHVTVPVRQMLDPKYLKARAALIDRNLSGGRRQPGRFVLRKGAMPGPSRSLERPSTSHISIVDAEGNALSMTTTIESAFGSGIMVRGFLLNNQLTDFSFRAVRNGRPVANRAAPGKRPRSSMAPTIVLGSDGRPYLIIGSPGGSRIIGYVARAIIGVLDWGLTVQQAVDLPHVLSRNGPAEIERGAGAGALAAQLKKLGHKVRPARMTSGLHGIRRLPDGRLEGGADPRREGIAAGE